MKPSTLKELKDELKYRSQSDLLELCLGLARFKKENKELLTYLLFEASNENAYIKSIQQDIDEQFENINKKKLLLYQKECPQDFKGHKKYIRSLFLQKIKKLFSIYQKKCAITEYL